MARLADDHVPDDAGAESSPIAVDTEVAAIAADPLSSAASGAEGDPSERCEPEPFHQEPRLVEEQVL